jgi:hypothetical protein
MSQARTVTAAFNATTVANGPLVAYSFNVGSGTTVPDVSGHGVTGTVSGASWTTGKNGSGLTFNGAGSVVTTPYATNLASWSISVWVKSPSAPSSGAPSGPLHREKNFQINWNHSNSALRGAAALQVGGTWYGASFGRLRANTWYHLAATYDGETLKAYKNGALVNSNSLPSGPPDAESAPLALGRHALVTQYFAGTIDDVRIYGRALAQAEIQTIMTTPLP